MSIRSNHSHSHSPPPPTESNLVKLQRQRNPTLFPISHDEFSVGHDIKILKAALSSCSKEHESTIINLLTKRSFSQREAIVEAYKESYGKDLSHDVSQVFSSKFLKVLLALLDPPNDFLAKEVEKALHHRLGVDHEVISEIICARSNAKISGIQLAYHERFGRTLLTTFENESSLSTDYKELISMLLAGLRHEVKETNRDKAQKRAASVHNAVQEGWSTGTKIFLRLLTHESFSQLCLIFDEYRLISGLAMEEAVKLTCSGDVAFAATTIVKAALNKSQFYAEVIEGALKKFRRDDSTLIRIFVSRAEIDLESIKIEYLKLYHKTLYNSIRTELSGPYKEIMLALLNTP